ncbi:MAG: ammonium transporter [Actinobacteria bacterium 69-20]|jgi:Amt family ammonium transporter|nr:MAG: ammonium transporter [Actinobacteria bacterium 69-20]
MVVPEALDRWRAGIPPLDAGNNAWMLVSAALVLLMTPGLAFFYGGMVRRKSVINMLMMSFSAMGTVGVVYVLWGYSMSFAGNALGGLVGNPVTAFGLARLGPTAADPNGLANSADAGSGVSGLAFAAFQLTFAIITVALISGAVADRMKFTTWLVFSVVWVSVVYFPLAHMVWGGGLLSGASDSLSALIFGRGPGGSAAIAPMDFAGGTVVHIDAGVAGIVLAFLLGRRKGHGRDPMRPHNVPFVMLGAGLLWFGWFGFNAGSAGGAGGLAALAWINTSTATSAAMLGWLAVERVLHGKATGIGAASGAVAGLVAITPGAGFVSPIGSVAIGALAGGICAWAIGLKSRLGLDDALDVGGVHLVGGIVGTVALGFFSTSTGLFYGGNADQLMAQAIIAGAAILFSGGLTLVIGLILRSTLGLRMSEDEEYDGDTAIHGESAYDFEGGTGIGSPGVLRGATHHQEASGHVASARAPEPASEPEEASA